MSKILYVLITDETNVQQSKDSKFFIYGGCIFPLEKVPKIHERISEIRQQAGFLNGQEFKFDSRSRPERISRETFTYAKKAVIDLAIEENVTFMASIVHHEIAKNKTIQEKILYSLKTIIAGFHKFLQRTDNYGQVISDRIDGIFNIHKEILSKGLDPIISSDFVSDNYENKIRLNKIWQFSVGTISSGHLMSLVDIVLGSFRYCVNYPERDASNKMYPSISKLLLHNPSDYSVNEEWGLLFRPKLVNVHGYENDYEELKENLRNLAKSAGDVREDIDVEIPF